MSGHTKAIENAQATLDLNRRKYKVISYIDERTMQFIATHPSRPGKFRIKFATPEYDNQDSPAEEIAQITAEIKSLEKISNDHVIKFYDSFVTENGDIWTIMDDFEGAFGLDKFVRVYASDLTAGDYNTITHQFFSGLAAIHGKGIVHRDIAPGNVVLRKEDFIDLRIIDFGLSVQEGKTLTRTLGTPGYIAPECSRGSKATAASDVYAGGTLISRLCSGLLAKPSAKTENGHGINPQSLINIPSEYREPFAAILTRCTRQEPSERYRDARSAEFDFHLLSRKQDLLNLEKMVCSAPTLPTFVAASHAYCSLFDNSQLPLASDSELLKKTNESLLQIKKKLSAEALAPYVRMLIKKNKLIDTEEITATTSLSPEELAKYSSKTTANNIVSAWTDLPPETYRVWTSLEPKTNGTKK